MKTLIIYNPFRKKTYLFKPYYYIGADGKPMTNGSYSTEGNFLDKKYTITKRRYKNAYKEYIRELKLDYPVLFKNQCIWCFPGKLI